MDTQKTASGGALEKGQSITREVKLKVTDIGKRQLDGIKEREREKEETLRFTI